MREHYRAELQQLHERLDRMARSVVASVTDAVAAMLDGDAKKAQKALHTERRIDSAEVQIEEECLKVIALHQPVADDLRFLIGVLKTDHELERVGDLAACIAVRMPRITPSAVEAYRESLTGIAGTATGMVEQSVRAFLTRDAELARAVWQRDETVDSLCDQLMARLKGDLIDRHDGGESRFELLAALADMERMADHATNIAKTAIYGILGRIVRHRGREFRRRYCGRKIRVLFVCVYDSGRGQMAAAWLNHLHGFRYEAESAGLTPGAQNPLVVQAMREAGIDISKNTPRAIDDVVQAGAAYDYVITVCDAVSADQCPPVAGIAEQIQWEFEDPAAFTGSDDEKLANARRLRDTIRSVIDNWAIVPEM